MLRRLRSFERIAFTLVVVFALGCTAVVAYESDQDAFCKGLQYGKDALRWTGEYTLACATSRNDDWECFVSE